MFAYAFHLTGARDEAERLSVAVFMDAHDMVAAGGTIRAVRVWLLMRVHGRAPILPHDRRGGSVRHLPPPGGHGITSMRAELALLDPPVEDALVLRQWCGLRPAEIATVLGVTPGEVRRALREEGAAAGRGRSPRRMAALVAGAGVGIAAAEMRAGVPKALAATVPGFGAGSAGTAAGAGAIPLIAGVAKGTLVVAAAAAAIGAAHTVAPRVAIPWPGGGGHSSGSGARSQPSGLHGHRHTGGKQGGRPGGNGGKGSHPGRPGDPSKHSHPSKPAHPAHPAKPAHPSHPSHPSKPAHPAKPVKPSHPAKPTRPTKPTHPARPVKPSHPAQPAGPSEPAEPSNP